MVLFFTQNLYSAEQDLRKTIEITNALSTPVLITPLEVVEKYSSCHFMVGQLDLIMPDQTEEVIVDDDNQLRVIEVTHLIDDSYAVDTGKTQLVSIAPDQHEFCLIKNLSLEPK